MIRKSPIRLIDENENMVGVVETAEALNRARDAGLDLVEIAPDSDPPVCRILDYGKYKYEQAKKNKAQKAKSKTQETKEVRLGRSMKIDQHDINIRMNQARKFLLEGHKVQIVQNMRGREVMHKNRAFDRMRDIEEQLGDIAKVEAPPRLTGRRLSMIIAPDKAKVEAYKKEHPDKARAEEPEADEAAQVDQPVDTPDDEAERGGL